MDALKAQLAKLQKQFAALNASQRMLVGTLVAVMALTILYWSKYAGSPEMTPVIDSVLNDQQISQVDNSLSLHGIPFQVVGGKVLVPTDRKTEGAAALMMDQALPEDTSSAFVDMNKDLNPFSGPSEHEESHNLAVQSTLEQIICHLPGVRTAKVIINAKNDRRIEDSVPPSASVWITSRGEIEHPKVLAKAIAKGVTGTVSGLRQENVVVNIDDHTVAFAVDGDNSSASSDDLQDAQQRAETREIEKIRAVLGFVPDLHLAVVCDVENSTTTSRSTSYDKSTSLSLPRMEHEKSEDNTAAAAPSAEPGIGANTSASIPTASSLSGGGGNSTSNSETTTENQNAFGSVEKSVVTPAGKDKVLSATVLIPRHWFVEVYKNSHKGDEPDEPTLTMFSDKQMVQLKDSVKNAIGVKADGDISMGMFLDTAPAVAMAPSTPTTSLPVALLTSHTKEIALGVLAVVSLFMMSSMVRKSAPAPSVVMAGAGGGLGAGMGAGMGMGTMPGAGGIGGVGGMGGMSLPVAAKVLGGGDGSIGDAAGGASMLDGVEMDENDIRTQQMLEQVSNMVKENPDNAAALVKRWMSRV